MTHTPESLAFQEEVRAELSALESTYTVNDSVRSALGTKSFTGLTGPFGIGKSTISDEVLRLEPSIQPIHTTTTRHRKPEDPAGFKTADEGVTFESLRDAVRHGELVNYSVIPGADIYGTYPQGFPAEHTIGPFLPTSIEHIKKAGFAHHNFVYVVTAGELWLQYVSNIRQNLSKDRFVSRVNESLSSIDFALHNIDSLSFIDNRDGEVGVTLAARQIAAIALNQSNESLNKAVAVQYLEQMRAVATLLAK